jgi:hypothetical protein
VCLEYFLCLVGYRKILRKERENQVIAFSNPLFELDSRLQSTRLLIARLFATIAVLLLKMLFQVFAVLSLSVGILAGPIVQHGSASLLVSDLALQKVLSDAYPIFGHYTKNSTKYSSWMAAYPDSTKLVHSTSPSSAHVQPTNLPSESPRST